MSDRLESLATTRRATTHPPSVLYYGGRTVPETVRSNPPSIWSGRPPTIGRDAKTTSGQMVVSLSQSPSTNAVKRLIMRYDKSGDGMLSKLELQHLLEEMFEADLSSVPLDETGVTIMMEAIDDDNSGSISSAEFLDAWNGWLGRALMPVRCLLIIDVQNDFITGSLAVDNGESVVPVVNAVREAVAWDVIGLSLDWHPFTHSSFLEGITENPPGSRPSELHPSATPKQQEMAKAPELFMELPLTSPNGESLSQVLWPRHCVQDSWGSHTHVDLVRQPSDLVILKGTDKRIDSYSAFFDNLKLRSTGLYDQLRERRVSHVYVCGIAFDYCVCFTALHAAAEGLVVTVVEDACRAVAPKTAVEMRAVMTEAGVRFCNAADLPRLFKADSLQEAIAAAKSVNRARQMAGRTLGLPTMGRPPNRSGRTASGRTAKK